MTGLRPARTLDDLMLVTGLSRTACKAAILSGELPGYKVGKLYTIPADAFDALCAGTWQPQPRELVITTINPIQSIRRVS